MRYNVDYKVFIKEFYELEKNGNSFYEALEILKLKYCIREDKKW